MSILALLVTSVLLAFAFCQASACWALKAIGSNTVLAAFFF